MDFFYNYSWGGISLDEDTSGDNSSSCSTADPEFYPSSFGIYLAVPEWEAIITAFILTFIILSTIVGNILVILSVFTYKPLRIVQNFFIVSLAVADLTVALLVMPLNVAYSILGEWIFGIHMCKMWLTSDVMCCTSSILNLCAIALDRFWAITDPINYAQKRTLERVMWMIAFVWILSLIICSPPLFGWNDWPEEFTPSTPCQLTSQPGYVIYSSAGSFFIPLLIMTVVYIEIFIATRKRLRERAKATRINAISSTNNKVPQNDVGKDTESVSSETHQEDSGGACKNACPGNRRVKKMKNYFARDEKEKNKLTVPILTVEESDNIDPRNTSSESNSKETQEENTDLEVNIIKKKSESVIAEKGTVYQFIEEKQRISLSRERRAARTLGIIMGVFVVCWLPFFLMYVIVPFCSNCCPSAKLINFITWLGYVNSALNPVIYTIFNMDFRRAFKKLLCIN